MWPSPHLIIPVSESVFVGPLNNKCLKSSASEKKRKKRGLIYIALYKYDILLSFYLWSDSTQHKTRGEGIEEGIKYSSYIPLLFLQTIIIERD